MSSLAIFNFESQEIRFVDGLPVANDVACVLGYKDPATAVYRKVKSKNKGVAELATPGGKQLVTLLKEPGIYQLIFASKLSSAEKFQDWVFDEVLPSIRRTGKYEMPQSITQNILPLSRETQAQLLFALKELHDVEPDDRTRTILKAQLINLVEASQQSEPQPQLLSVTEVCKIHGIKLPSGKDSAVGRKVASAWRAAQLTEPAICKKMLDTGHCSEIKVYPADFFQRIIAIAQEYIN